MSGLIETIVSQVRSIVRDVGLQLGIFSRKLDRVLDADHGPVTDTQCPQAIEADHRAGMVGADRLADDDVPMDQLEPVVLGQDAGLAHPVVLLDGEAVPGQQLTHATPPTAILLRAA